MRGKTDSWRNCREVVVDSRKPMSQGSEYMVRCLSSHSAHYDLLTSLKISQAVSLFSDANTQDSLPFGPTHTLRNRVTCPLCAGVNWMLSGIEVHKKLQLILLQRTLHSEKQRKSEMSQSRKWECHCPHINLASQLPCSSDHSNFSEGNGNMVW